MKTGLLLLLPFSVLAQDSERLLTETDQLLTINRNKANAFFRDTRLVTQPDTAKKTADYFAHQGRFYLVKQEPGRAVALFEQSAALNPKEYGYLGYSFLTQWHDYPRAIQYLNAYDALTPNFDDVEGNNPVSYLRGLAYQKLGNHPKAIEQMSLGIDPIDLKHGSEWVNYRYFINRAVSYLAMQQPEKALTDLDKAVKNFSRSALAQYYRGRALLALNRRTEAKTAFQDAAFFLKALRAERGNYQEDEYNPVCEEEVDEALAELN